MFDWVRDAVKLIRAEVQRAIAEDLETHEQCVVVSYDAALNLVSIQPVIKRIRTDDPNNMTTILGPQIDDVPVQQAGSGKCLLTVAPQPGSYGTYHVSARDFSAWLDAGGVQDPASSRKFDISHGTFEPGTYPTTTDGDNGKLSVAIQTDRVEIRTRDRTGYVSVLDNGKVEINGTTVEVVSSSDAAALASIVDDYWTKMYTAVNTWVPVANDGGAAFKTNFLAQFTVPPTTAASAKLKVDS
jgi:hypothetical protein